MHLKSLTDPYALRQDGSKPLTANWDAGPFKITAQQLESDVAIGTAPFVVTSTTLVTNLNADLWDGYEFADYLNQDVKTTASPTFVTLNATSLVATDLTIDTNLIKTISAQNFVGINKTTPVHHLDVVGRLQVAGNDGAIGTGEDPGGDGDSIYLYPGDGGADGGAGAGADGKVVVTKGILFTDPTESDIVIGGRSTNDYYIESQTSGKGLTQGFFTKDADATDNNYMIFYAKGTMAAPPNRETLVIGYFTTPAYRIQSGTAGTGTVHPIKIYTGANTDQFTLLATGNNTMAGSLMVGAATEAVTKLTIEGALTLKEQAAADGDTAAYGQLWVKTVTPNQLWFTNDAGNDSELSLVAYGEIFAIGVADTITITAALQANKVQITSFDTNGASINSTPDHTNDHITITKAGFYLCAISLHIESAGGGAADTFGFSVYKNDGDTEFANCHAHRKLAGGGGDVGSVSISGIIDLAVNDTIELWCWNEDSTDDLVVQDVTLSLVWIGST